MVGVKSSQPTAVQDSWTVNYASVTFLPVLYAATLYAAPP